MAAPEGLEAISRDILAAYYDEHPYRSLSNDVDLLSYRIQSMAFNLLSESVALPDEELLVDELRRNHVCEIERNLWKNREHIEEITHLLDRSRWPPILHQPSTPEDSEIGGVLDKIADVLRECLANLVSFQDMISERVFDAVTFRLPRTIARTLIDRLKKQETNDKSKVDDLVASGASIGARCALLWEQQMERRRQLAKSCNKVSFIRATYMYKDDGIPKDVLSSLPKINNDEWPMEEQSVRYGPTLDRLTLMILSIRLFLLLSWGRYESAKLHRGQITFLDQAVDVYTCECKKFITFLSEVFTGSPFFKCYDFEEINVAAGETHEVSLKVYAVNSKIAWDFRLAALEMLPTKSMSMNIDFTVEFTDASENKTIIYYLRSDVTLTKEVLLQYRVEPAGLFGIIRTRCIIPSLYTIKLSVHLQLRRQKKGGFSL